MKKLIMVGILSFTFCSVSHAGLVSGFTSKKVILLLKCLASNQGDPAKCLDYLDDDTAKSAGIFTYTRQGKGDNLDECKQDAISAVESGLLIECEKKNSRTCNQVGATKFNNDLKDNPSVTVGGLSGKRKKCSATAYAKPN